MLLVFVVLTGLSLVSDAWCAPFHVWPSRWTTRKLSSNVASSTETRTTTQVHLSAPTLAAPQVLSAQSESVAPEEEPLIILAYDVPPGILLSNSNFTTLFGFGSTLEDFKTFVTYMTGDASSWSPDAVRNQTFDSCSEDSKKELASHWSLGCLLISDSTIWNKHVLSEGSFSTRLVGLVQRMRSYYYGTKEEAPNITAIEKGEPPPEALQTPPPPILSGPEMGSPSELLAWLESQLPDQWILMGNPPRAPPAPGLGPRARRVAFDPERSEASNVESLQCLMSWFKAEYPYYYSACGACSESGRYLGQVASNEQEKEHCAGRTELVTCEACGHTTRFPRFNDVRKVLFETRKGRCGEYSVAAMALLEVLGWEARWVVDWADHVWVEVWVPANSATAAAAAAARSVEGSSVGASASGGADGEGFEGHGGRWVHCDPCEAAVDEPLIYEGWGKNATFIFAFNSESIVDVTASYTSNATAARYRRTEDPADIESSIRDAVEALRRIESDLSPT